MKTKIFLLIAWLSIQSAGAQRIITAGSAITETVCALGDCDKIIATDLTSKYPDQVQKLPSIGYRSSIAAEGIISLKPTLVIAEKDYVDAAVLNQLSSTDIKLIIVDRKHNFNDTKKYIAQIAYALGREHEGKKLVAKNEAELAQAKAMLNHTTTKPKVLCVYNRGAANISMAGNETFAEILNYVGAENPFENVEGYKPLNTESLIAGNPDYLLMLSSGLESLGGIDGALKINGIDQTTAGKKKQIVAMESLKLTNFGPRFGEAVKELVALLHPEIKTAN